MTLFTLVSSSGVTFAAFKAFLSVLLTKAGELSPAMAFWRSIVLARISSSVKPLLANSRLMAAKICQKNSREFINQQLFGSMTPSVLFSLK